MGEIDIEKVCRICLKESHYYSNIYHDQFLDESLFYEIINDLCQLDVEFDDGLPKFLCCECYIKISEFELFKRRAHEGKSVLLCMKERIHNIGIKLEDGIEREYEEEYFGIHAEVDVEIEEGSEPMDFKDEKGEEHIEYQYDRTYLQPNPASLDHGSRVKLSSKSRDLNFGPGEDISFKCFTCEDIFSDSRKLSEHVKLLHTSEKIFSCDMCEKSFSRNSRLKTHKRSHTGERPYKCGDCDKAFVTGSDLNVHKRIHTGDRPYGCNLCQKRFHDRKTLKRHQMVHTGERPFHCPFTSCDKRFSRNIHLKTHVRSHHTGERPYACNLCDKTFVCGSELNRHQRVHT